MADVPTAPSPYYRPRRNPARTGVTITVPGPTPEVIELGHKVLVHLSLEAVAWHRIAYNRMTFLLRCMADAEYPSGLLADVRSQAAESRATMRAVATELAATTTEQLRLAEQIDALWDEAAPAAGEAAAPAAVRVTGFRDYGNGVLVVEAAPSGS
jgi:hypothetical protein